MIFPFVSILLVGILGGIIPLVRRWTDRQHHAALAFSTGIFLGAVFLHLLPSVTAAGASHDHESHAHAEVTPAVGEAANGDAGQAEESHVGDDHEGHDHEGHDHADHDHEGGDHDHGAAQEDAEAVDAHAGHAHGPVGPWIWVLVGVLGVFLIEALMIPGSTHGHGHGHNDAERHTAVGWAALVGLTVHALTAGVALAAVQGQRELAGVMLLAILAHKGFESFSLASVFGMTGAARGKIITMVVAFSLVTPIGLLLGGKITAFFGEGGIGILTSLSAGTFLYVCLCELLPEVFHRREDGPLKITLLLGGIVVMWYAHTYGGI